ncbi:TPD1 protein homolog 1B-like [Brachypodium distachyon]|uniref:TPD1 protein homolog 1B-like n=1 Tax=Brachypodium distachyon TaxID=15368 RepID=UPI00071C754E|nr:TPD1 protein homolog 1B-like [Brachypodium distachyon]|eukprot:XP_014757836.1 TPD1 protein homolog 1B-like [Brachypodium distachyon]
MLNSRGGSRPEISSPDGCSKENVVVYQNDAPNLPSGIPAYSVEVINSCAGCTVHDVHLSCGNFGSTELVDPAQFRRIAYDDCLVNDGKPMGPGDSVSFHYSNSFWYPLKVASVACN